MSDKLLWAKLYFERFYIEVLAHDKCDAELASWLRTFSRELALHDEVNCTDPFALKLLNDASSRSEQNRKNKTEGRKQAKKEDLDTTTVNDRERPLTTVDGSSQRREEKREKRVIRGTAEAFVPPTEEQVAQYIKENGYPVSASKFISHYESNGWLVGKNKMKNWKSAVRTWLPDGWKKPQVEQTKITLVPLPQIEGVF